jgi:hypothetical protein
LIAQPGATEDQCSLNRWFAGRIDKRVQFCTDGSNIASVAFSRFGFWRLAFSNPQNLSGVFFGAFHMVDLFLTLGGILLVGIVAKVGMGLVFGWQTERESTVTGRRRTE